MVFVPLTEHTMTRPSWDCRNCGQPWPCANAKIDLAEEYARFPTATIVYLSTAFDEAGGDLADAAGHFPVDLYERFLAWVTK